MTARSLAKTERFETRPRIAICFFGITRSLTHTIGSIEQKIFAPARDLGEVRVFAHFFRQTRIDNPRSGEMGALRQDEYNLISPDWLKLEEPDVCLEAHGFNALKTYGDRWNDEFRSLRNLVHQLHSLSSVCKAAQQWQPDIVVFARPDLQYKDTLKPTMAKAINLSDQSVVFIPDWQHSMTGYNDRFAVATVAAAKAYGQRLEVMHLFCQQQGRALHSESLLKYALKREKVSVRYADIKASRVRSNGQIHTEQFKGRIHFRLKRIVVTGRQILGFSDERSIKSQLLALIGLET